MTLRDRIRSSIQLLATASLGQKPRAGSREPGTQGGQKECNGCCLLQGLHQQEALTQPTTQYGSEPLCQIPVQLARVINRKCEL